MSEIRELRWENDSKSAPDVHFFIFFHEKPLPLKFSIKEKTFGVKRNVFRFFCLKNRNAHQFHAFTHRNDFENMSETG